MRKTVTEAPPKALSRRRMAAENAGQSPPRTRQRKPRVDRIARKAEFLHAAARAFLDLGSGASMQEVATYARAQKAVFYRVFPSRAALIDALFQHIHDACSLAYQSPWRGYGSRLLDVYLRARNDREIFIVGLKVFRGAPELDSWRDRIFDIVHMGSLAFFKPGANAPAGAERRAIQASRSLNTLFLDTLVLWLEDNDGLSDEARLYWWASMAREWRRVTRIAYELDGPLPDNLKIPPVAM
jgi:AcrR family transcriptional regulator